MPRLSDTMTEGILGAWLKDEGQPVRKGDALVEIETDKVTLELEASADGTLLRILAAQGSAVAPGVAVAFIGPAGTVPPDGSPRDAASAGASVRHTTRPAMSGRPERLAAATACAKPRGSVDAASPPLSSRTHRLRATPLARRTAQATGVTLEAIGRGSGPNGRILRHDVERAASLVGGDRPPRTEDTLVVPSRRRMTMARRLSEAKREIPHYYIDTAVDVSALMKLRAEARKQEAGLDVPVTAYILRATALSLRAFPRVNATWSDDQIVLRGSVNLGLAVAIDDDELLVPVLHDVDEKTVVQIAAETARLSNRARERSITPAELEGSSFTISNLGMFGIDSFHAIINPPEAGILAAGAVRPTPVVEESEVVVRQVLKLSLSADHRVYSGASAAAFLSDVRARLEHPLDLLQ